MDSGTLWFLAGFIVYLSALIMWARAGKTQEVFTRSDLYLMIVGSLVTTFILASILRAIAEKINYI
jgi:hypothetical protein